MEIIKFKRNELEGFAVISENYAKTSEYCARTCYNVEDRMEHDTWYRYLASRVKSGHESVIEHNSITVVMIANTDEYKAKLNSLLLKVSTINNLIKVDSFDNHIIMTGNVKMFRDFMKGWKKLYGGDPLHLSSILVNLLKTSGDLFTSDIYDESTKFTEWIDRDFDIVQKFYVQMRDIKLTPVELSDDKMKLDIINLDSISDILEVCPEYGYIINQHKLMFGSVTYRVKIARAISQQDSRHRIQAKSQKSQRYVNETKKCAGHYTPDCIDKDKSYLVTIGDTEMYITYEDYMKLSFDLYARLQEDGIKNEDARNVLTNATYTEYCITKPFYTLGHYFYERCSNAAQHEIRVVAEGLRKYVNENTDIEL